MSIGRKIATLREVYITFGIFEIFRLLWQKLRTSKHQESFKLKENSIRVLSSLDEVESYLIKNYPAPKLRNQKDYLEILSSIETVEHRNSFFDTNYDMGDLALYSIFLILQNIDRTTVLETGVAAGKSTTLILKALTTMNKSDVVLVSTDITNNCGELIPENLKRQWIFRKLGFRAKRDFLSVLKFYEDVSIFIHDSDHSKEWEEFEVGSVIQHCSKLKFIVVDDVHESIIHLLSESEWNLCLLQEEMKTSLLAIRV